MTMKQKLYDTKNLKDCHAIRLTLSYQIKFTLEGKGQFLTADRRKHRLIREQFGDKYDIRFVFSNPNQRIGKKSKTRYRDWCERYGFKWAHLEIPKEWIEENAKK